MPAVPRMQHGKHSGLQRTSVACLKANWSYVPCLFAPEKGKPRRRLKKPFLSACCPEVKGSRTSQFHGVWRLQGSKMFQISKLQTCKCKCFRIALQEFARFYFLCLEASGHPIFHHWTIVQGSRATRQLARGLLVFHGNTSSIIILQRCWEIAGDFHSEKKLSSCENLCLRPSQHRLRIGRVRDPVHRIPGNTQRAAACGTEARTLALDTASSEIF